MQSIALLAVHTLRSGVAIHTSIDSLDLPCKT